MCTSSRSLESLYDVHKRKKPNQSHYKYGLQTKLFHFMYVHNSPISIYYNIEFETRSLYTDDVTTHGYVSYDTFYFR